MLFPTEDLWLAVSCFSAVVHWETGDSHAFLMGIQTFSQLWNKCSEAEPGFGLISGCIYVCCEVTAEASQRAFLETGKLSAGLHPFGSALTNGVVHLWEKSGGGKVRRAVLWESWSSLESKAMSQKHRCGISKTRTNFWTGPCWWLPVEVSCDPWCQGQLPLWGGFLVHRSVLWTCSVSHQGDFEPFQ